MVHNPRIIELAWYRELKTEDMYQTRRMFRSKSLEIFVEMAYLRNGIPRSQHVYFYSSIPYHDEWARALVANRQNERDISNNAKLVKAWYVALLNYFLSHSLWKNGHLSSFHVACT